MTKKINAGEQISVKNLIFGYGTGFRATLHSDQDLVFDNVSLQINSSWKLGFTGRNGRGKTTFLRLLMGELDYAGVIDTKVKFQYFPYGVSDPALTTLENVQKLVGDLPNWQIGRELSLLKVKLDVLGRAFSTLSFGEQTKVQLAVLFLRAEQSFEQNGQTGFLLIDEPTNHLDQAARHVLAEYLQRKQTGFILVSHDRELLDACTDHTLSINKTNIVVNQGNYGQFLANKQVREQFERAEDQKLQRIVRNLETSAKRSSAFAVATESAKGRISGQTDNRVDTGFVGKRAAKMAKRAKQLERRQNQALIEARGLLHNVENIEELTINPLPWLADLEVTVLAPISAELSPAPAINSTLTIHEGDKIALQGPNGCGKTTYLRELLTELGQSYPKLKVSYLAQSSQNTDIESDTTDFNALSEGEKRITLLKQSLAKPAHIYIWDEPLNYIDIYWRRELERLLTQGSNEAMQPKPTIIFVEHDQGFVKVVANRKYVILPSLSLILLNTI